MKPVLFLIAFLFLLCFCGPDDQSGNYADQSGECERMLARMADCGELDRTTKQLIEQSGFEEGGACWDDPEYARACIQTCINYMNNWDKKGICK